MTAMEDSTEIKRKNCKSRSDKSVQGTNDSSIVSKCSMVKSGYFKDDFLKLFVSKAARRSPLIHRGYYIRAVTVDYILKRFLRIHAGENRQILSLGAGFDSAYFRLKSDGCLDGATFIEVDFMDVVKRKAAVISAHNSLQELIGKYSVGHNPVIVVDSPDYKLLGVDLSQRNLLDSTLEQLGVNPAIPTLVLSECVLTYMMPKSSSSLIQWAGEKFCNAVFLLYEQINPDDAFGIFMQKHFHNIGSPLRGINSFTSMKYQIERFQALGWPLCKALDMNQSYYRVVSPEERSLVEHIEPFDEYEEWYLKCSHYMVLCAYKGSCQNVLANIAFDESDASMPSVAPSSIPSIIHHKTDKPIKRFGHTATMVGDIAVVIGGFGEQDGRHQRMLDVCMYNLNTYTSTSVQFNANVNEAARMYHTTTLISENRLLLLFGRTSPCKCCERAFIIRLHGSQDTVISTGTSDNTQSTTSLNNNTMQRLDSVSSQSDHEMTKPEEEFKENKHRDLLRFNGKNYDSILTSECDGKCSTQDNAAGFVDNSMDLSQCSILCEEICPNGDVPCPRWRHSAVAVSYKGSECVIIYGGRNIHHLSIGDCHLFDINTGLWKQVIGKGTVPGPRHSHTASVWQGHMIIAGGLNSDLQPTESIFMLNIETETWIAVQTSIKIYPRFSHTAHVVDDCLILVGGVNLNHSPPGIAFINLCTGIAMEAPLPAHDKDNLIMYHSHSSILLPGNKLALFGGGGNCFSFGTHFNRTPVTVDVNPCLQAMT